MDRKVVREIVESIYQKMLVVAARCAHKIPYTVDLSKQSSSVGSSSSDGMAKGSSSHAGCFADDWTGRDISWWTNGFFAGTLWQLYAFKKNSLFRRVAERIEKKLDSSLLSASGMDHDSGFKWLLTSNANFLLTKNKDSENRLLLAAGNLAGRFNIQGNFLRAWNDDTGETAGLAIIDCMMNLPLLYLASERTHDPRFFHIALRHAETALRAFVREDGSVRHIVLFDPLSGEVVGERGGQGMDVGSSWTRGQAWALYGFALSYRHTGKPEFLKASERVARNFLSRFEEFGAVPSDFCQPKGCSHRDDSAAAIAASGLSELHTITGNEEFSKGADRLLAFLLKKCDLSDDNDFLLWDCSVAYDREQHVPLVYADYFFVEALLKQLQKEIGIW